ncbi:MAG: GNAT family N-acetyltransferase [Lapillicoccus sp.]
MFSLISPSADRHAAWLDMVQEFEGAHIDGSGVMGRSVDDLIDPDTFTGWVAEARAHERGEDVPPELVASTLRWVVDVGHPETILGTISLRHELNDYLRREGGHIGYAVRPSARGRGVATAALGLVLKDCHDRGIDPVLVTCHDDNVASARTIEHQGGVLEEVRGGIRRYWISLSQS